MLTLSATETALKNAYQLSQEEQKELAQKIQEREGMVTSRDDVKKMIVEIKQKRFEEEVL